MLKFKTLNTETETTLLKFLGPADPKNTGQKLSTKNFWIVVKFWAVMEYSSIVLVLEYNSSTIF